MTDLDNLERLARAATPGPWEWDADREHLNAPAGSGRDSVVLFAAPVGYQNSSVLTSDEDAAYIAAASPSALLALIAEVRALREHVAGIPALLANNDRLVKALNEMPEWERAVKAACSVDPVAMFHAELKATPHHEREAMIERALEGVCQYCGADTVDDKGRYDPCHCRNDE